MQAPLTVWIGPWFNTAYHFVQALRDNPEQRRFVVIGSSHNPRSPVFAACDQSFQEPTLADADYAAFCLAYCRDHQIDIFIPGYRKFLLIAPHLSAFAALGTRVLLGTDPDLLHFLDDKAATYAALADGDIVAVPDYRLVSNAEAFRQAYLELERQYRRICFKPRHGQGGAGFRIIDNRLPQLDALYRHPSYGHLRFEEVYALLSTVEQFPELIVSEYLEGTEYSIDCLAQAGHLYAAVPRCKVDSRLRYLEHNPALLTLAEKFTAAYPVSYLFNIQIKYQDEVPKLIEINPRMSGGLYYTRWTGVNLPYLAIKLLLGEAIDKPILRLNQMVADMGQAVLFETAS